MASKKQKAKATKPGKKPKPLVKAELFALAYIENVGNATKTAKEVLGIEGDDAAARCGAEYVRNPQVQEIVRAHMAQRRKDFEEFMNRAHEYRSRVLITMLKRMEDPETSVADLIKLGEAIARFTGTEISEAVSVAKANSRGGGSARAQLPGLAPPGVQSGLPQGNVDNSRKVVFMLNPPPLPAGGVPPPALLEQWQETYRAMGVDLPVPNNDNAGDGTRPASSPHNR